MAKVRHNAAVREISGAIGNMIFRQLPEEGFSLALWLSQSRSSASDLAKENRDPLKGTGKRDTCLICLSKSRVVPGKFHIFLGVLREFGGSKLLSDINLRKPCVTERTANLSI